MTKTTNKLPVKWVKSDSNQQHFGFPNSAIETLEYKAIKYHLNYTDINLSLLKFTVKATKENGLHWKAGTVYKMEINISKWGRHFYVDDTVRLNKEITDAAIAKVRAVVETMFMRDYNEYYKKWDTNDKK